MLCMLCCYVTLRYVTLCLLCYFKNDLIEISKKKELEKSYCWQIHSFSLLVRPAGKAAIRQFYPTVHTASTGAKMCTIDWWELIKPPEKKNTVLQVGEILFCFRCSGLAILFAMRAEETHLDWNHRPRWLHDVSGAGGKSRLSLPSPLRPAALQIPCFPWEAMFLRRTAFCYSKKTAVCSDWGSAIVLSCVF